MVTVFVAYTDVDEVVNKKVGLFILTGSLPMAQTPSDIGSSIFKPISSKTMTLKYGFKGASVYDNALKKWQFYKMTTITHHKVEDMLIRLMIILSLQLRFIRLQYMISQNIIESSFKISQIS
ncbi:MAG: hypothetical protein ABDH19_04625 [Thermodesulfovibrio sp.]